MDRRTFLGSGIAGSAAAAFGPYTRGVEVTQTPSPSPGVLLNRERASDILRRAALDGVVVSSPLNVYYVTNAVPVLSRFTPSNTTIAILPADAKRPIAYIAGGGEYYNGIADSGLADGVRPYLVVEPNSIGPAFKSAGTFAYDAREQRRRALLGAAPFRWTHGCLRSNLSSSSIPSILQRSAV